MKQQFDFLGVRTIWLSSEQYFVHMAEKTVCRGQGGRCKGVTYHAG